MIEQDIIKISAHARLNVGTGSSRALRRSGAIPAIIYGKGRDPISISIIHKDFLHKCRSLSLATHLIELDIDNNKEYVLLRDIQKHPVSDAIQHVDFQFVNQNAEIKVDVPIVLINEHKCIGIKHGGTLNILHRTLSLKCSPQAIPQTIEIDLSNLTVGHSIHVSDLELPDKVTVVMKEENSAIVTISSAETEKDSEAASSIDDSASPSEDK
ncbi:50S ribosomal protein L25/general stress protein Ctc [Neoehrlichia mikurensis]|uniref:Large ribosomal subunit protein bL25 n=1 Tax=Neoehrlichia mikurensis TaxID=89586 RepID=A0A9Q9BZ04_9RICK|nr:50S ribosomal protein L25/general stress protein Ctc [Neoehrlichia mikurensis]QXK92252.1 50S ribosomal protein L25/general stress protein Ctc [Neoehrlichia mikurensis]QXK92707.1 50S ribosomal protein L25/general stress protein Ctc [Neoehrlichia mikurensis]QXK93945.1 50S ribosomal protein L25/general stress protein Ctc [Neoehrlichia mikurensis]UTO55891.1 50S ribosomal protein L25/general stress protein Ctc [Neoehrlichia mikurensis]UTO56807.1 50S ribosomal protein L25/general stress protein C